MGITPEMAIFRGFGALNARNLLYYQNELIYLENELKAQEAEDAKSADRKKARYGLDAFWLNDMGFWLDGKCRDGDMRQRELMLRIRCVLKEYSMLLPKKKEKRKRSSCSPITDDVLIQQATILQNMKEPKAPDLVVLRGRNDTHAFSRKIGTRAIHWIRNHGGKRWKEVTVHGDTIAQIAFWVTSSIASILPVMSIIILANTNSLHGRLAIIAASNVLTSVSLLYFTDARRIDVFAITAA
jgi:hypothetical protein